MAFDARAICGLTKQPGRWVKSHILPESLTRPSIKGNAFFQYRGAGVPTRPVRRWTSWYDSRLVCAEGEHILSDIDSAAVAELRRHRLVWSGWGDSSSLPAPHKRVPGGPIGVRVVEGVCGTTLRLFFLSILWRAASTTLEEFAEVVVGPDEMEKLRLMILNRDVEPLSFYPCQLTQLSTRGAIHNHAPIKDMKYAPDGKGGLDESVELPTYRFYFDGLIVHMHIALPEQWSVETLGGLIVGAGDALALSTVTFEGSLQYASMREVMDRHGL